MVLTRSRTQQSSSKKNLTSQDEMESSDEDLENVKRKSLYSDAHDKARETHEQFEKTKGNLPRKNLYSSISEDAQNIHKHLSATKEHPDHEEPQSLSSQKRSVPGDIQNESETCGLDVADGLPPPHSILMSQPDKVFTKKDGNMTIFLVLISILLVCLAIYSRLSKSPPHLSSMEKFNNYFSDLQNEFKGQEEKSWRVIYAAIRANMNRTSAERPAVVLLTSSLGAEAVTSCLADKLTEILAESLGSKTMPTIITDVKDTRKEIDDKIISSIDQSSAVVVKNLEKFSHEQVSLLHGHCDDQEAPVKNSYFILTLNTYENFSRVVSLKSFDQFAYATFLRIWDQMPEDLIYPLLSRLTPSVALVKKTELPSFC